MCKTVFSFVRAIVNIYLKSQAIRYRHVTCISLDCSFKHWSMTLLSFDLLLICYSYFLPPPRRRRWFWGQRGGHCVTACPPTLSAEPHYSPVFICLFMNLLVRPYSLCVCVCVCVCACVCVSITFQGCYFTPSAIFFVQRLHLCWVIRLLMIEGILIFLLHRCHCCEPWYDRSFWFLYRPSLVYLFSYQRSRFEIHSGLLVVHSLSIKVYDICTLKKKVAPTVKKSVSFLNPL